MYTQYIVLKYVSYHYALRPSFISHFNCCSIYLQSTFFFDKTKITFFKITFYIILQKNFNLRDELCNSVNLPRGHVTVLFHNRFMGRIGSAVLTLIGYKHPPRQTDKNRINEENRKTYIIFYYKG